MTLTNQCRYCKHEQWVHSDVYELYEFETPQGQLHLAKPEWRRVADRQGQCCWSGCRCQRFNTTEVDGLLDELAGV